MTEWQKYLKENNVLNESPYIDFSKEGYDDENFDDTWDFYSEFTKNGTWMTQLITLFRDGHLEAVDRNGELQAKDITEEQKRICVRRLMTDLIFVNTTHHDYKLLNDETKSQLEKYVPTDLMDVIKNGLFRPTSR